MQTRSAKFYAGEITDGRNRKLTEIQAWPEERLEATHDFIQWLFPLPEASPVNPTAPLLDRATREEFQAHAELRVGVRQSLETMVKFYGFVFAEDGARVLPGPDFDRAAENWLQPGNHNHLRITRILRASRLLGQAARAQAFFRALEELYATGRGRDGISKTTFRYWLDAMSGT